MGFNKKDLLWTAIFITIFFLLSCSSASQQFIQTSAGKSSYLQNNIHSQVGSRDIKASYANWTDPGSGHIIIPVNTSVEIGKYRRGFAIKDMSDGRIIYFEYNKERMGMAPEQYIGIITASTKVDLKSFSEIDQKGIQDGKAYIAMSKKGVRTALGYPAAHQTSSLENNTWVYWRNRWKTMAVEFGDDGKVKNLQD